MLIFSKTNKIVRARRADYVLKMYMKKHEIAYLNYAEAKRLHQVQKIIYSNPASDIVRSVKTTVYDQNNSIQ